PARDMCPQTLEEKSICYADKFFSKSGNLTEKKSLQKVISQMEKFGPDSLNRFMALHEIFAS
ncbi:MAG: phosphohydrolase, partial [Muribaculaceae bacterium]|nr:phosphohydrolase [Muribaculaceae bacterium]